MKKLLLILIPWMLLSGVAFAYDGDLSISGSDIRFSPSKFLEGNTVRIYATVTNLSKRDLLGVVRFYGNDRQINGDQAISVFAGKTDDVFVDWAPAFWGKYTVTVKIIPWEPAIDNPTNNSVSEDIFVLQDTDHDGLSNNEDPDDDNDGVPDDKDAFPLNAGEQYDTDGDGVGNNADLDDDNDGVPDTQDEMPLDPTETLDTDKDGIGNNVDEDDDNDKLSDIDELRIGTDPLNPDTDGDSVMDGEDAFPLDPREALDTDKDSIGNNTDTDDDNDGIIDTEDQFPLNKAPQIKLNSLNPIAPLLDEKVFDASPSHDDDGQIVSYNWKIDGKALEGNSVKYIFTKTGKHVVSLTVADDQGQKVTKDFQVNVINIKLYAGIISSFLALLLALLIYFKYIYATKKLEKEEITDK